MAGRYQSIKVELPYVFTACCLKEMYQIRGNGYAEAYRQNDESEIVQYSKDTLNQLLNLVDSKLRSGVSIFDEIAKLISQLDLVVDFSEFSRFYEFFYFIFYAAKVVRRVSIYDVVRYKLHHMRKKLKDELEDKNTVQEYVCPNCRKRYNALDALQLLSLEELQWGACG